MNNYLKKLFFVCAFSSVLTSINVQAQSVDTMIAPPKVNINDPFGVNIATGQVTASVDTVSIGGELGLSHNISGHTNNFSITGFQGSNDKFQGALKFTKLGDPGLMVDGNTYQAPFYVMRAFGPGGTQDFKFISSSNSALPHPPTNTSNYTYRALADSRHTLVENADNYTLDWTLPDGTIHRFRRLASSHSIRGNAELIEVIYPNGFTLYRHGYNGVSTNTGYQVKYVSEIDTRTASSAVCYAPDRGPQASLACNPALWAAKNPARYIAINNTVETCAFAATEKCSSLEEDWPTASVLWPAGMPKGIYVGDNDVVITNAEGEETKLHFSAQDLRERNPGDPNAHEPIIVQAANKFAPRLVGITPAGATERVFEYEYHNSYFVKAAIACNSAATVDLCSWLWWLDSPVGKIVGAKGPSGSAGYFINQGTGVPNEQTNVASWGGVGITARIRVGNQAPGTIATVSIDGEGKYTYEGSYTYRNFVNSFSPAIAPNPGPKPPKTWAYTKNNVSKITIADDPESENASEITASFDTPCSTSTRNRCNKPTAVTDARGKTTLYEYHTQSGQLAKVTQPADKHNIRPQTRYQYTALSASYMDPDTEQTVSGSPIWLKTREAYCKKGAASENGCELTGDEVVTTYDYGPTSGFNNLQLRGVTVTTENGESRTACYRYDIYGNRIGETKPKANASCY